MTKINEQIERIVNKRIEQTVKKTFTKPLLDKVGREAVKQIVKRTRLGKGARPITKKTYPLPGLADSTIDYRERYDYNLSPYTRPNRSNVTATGQLLNSIWYRTRFSSTLREVELYFKENRSRELNGGPAKIKHKKLAEYIEKNGRPFFYLADFELRKLRSIIADAFKNSI